MSLVLLYVYKSMSIIMSVLTDIEVIYESIHAIITQTEALRVLLASSNLILRIRYNSALLGTTKTAVLRNIAIMYSRTSLSTQTLPSYSLSTLLRACRHLFEVVPFHTSQAHIALIVILIFLYDVGERASSVSDNMGNCCIRSMRWRVASLVCSMSCDAPRGKNGTSNYSNYFELCIATRHC